MVNDWLDLVSDLLPLDVLEQFVEWIYQFIDIVQ